MAARPFAKLNHLRYRLIPPSTGKPLHVGCGGWYIEGFLNIDLNPFQRVDLWLDVRNGLPLADDSVGFIYTAHTVEHLYPDELDSLLSECRRVLRRGGGIRIVVPNLRTSIQAYIQDRAEWFGDWPRSFQSMGGRLTNYILCNGQHRMAFDFGYLEELLLAAGFASVKERKPMESEHCKPEVLSICEQEADPDLPRSVYVEAVK